MQTLGLAHSFFHLPPQTQRPHIGPHLFDVRQTFRFGTALFHFSPALRGFSICRPYGVLLLVIDDYFVDRIVFSVFSIHFSLLRSVSAFSVRSRRASLSGNNSSSATM